MSKIPVDKHSQNRNKERSVFSNSQYKEQSDNKSKCSVHVNGITAQFCTNYSILPNTKDNKEENSKRNPRILDLRLKLNEISKKKDGGVDKVTKGLINDITQQLVEEHDPGESGPYSLIFDLQCNNASTSKESHELSSKVHLEELSMKTKDAPCTRSNDSLNKIIDRLPTVVHIDEKPLREFEYSCVSETSFPIRKQFPTQSRSELCLNFKSYTFPRPFESHISPHENSLGKGNEENSLDDSLGILTPDQMDDICFLENAFSPTVEGLPRFCDKTDSKGSSDTGDSPSTDKTDSHSAESTIQNEVTGCTDKKSTAESKTHIVSNESDNILEEKDRFSRFIPSLEVQSFDCNQEKTINPHTFVEDEFMPSVHSSILEPASSIAEIVGTLDFAFDSKSNENHLRPQRIEQTPSPEDLPLDSCDINIELSTYSQFSVSISQDSQGHSDSKTDFPKSMETSKVSNSFITSITSITSLDGYQGDGEMSRPVSRNADHSILEEAEEMDWQNVPVTRRADPMTDSDFFTESDADGLDDHMQRGDRRAQVIDGALYGGKNGSNNPPLIVNRSEDSCMDSSGVYTDFETHVTSPIFLNVIDDLSPEGSTTSTQTECSQNNITGQVSQKLNKHMENDVSLKTSESKTPKVNSKRNSLNSEKDFTLKEKCSKEEKRFTLKKYKMPKRDVPSKLKSMLASRKNDVNSSNQNSPNVTKKNERRESFAKKNFIENKNEYKIKSLKDVKSKIDSSFSLQRSQTTCSVTRMLSSKSTNPNTKPKSRHMRMRMELGSANGSGKSSLHSSQSDLSASSTPLGKVSSSRYSNLRNGKKRETIPTGQPSPRASLPAPQPPTPATAKKNGVVQKLAASPISIRSRTSLAPPQSPRKTTPRRVPAQRPNTLPTNTKEAPRVAAAIGPRGKRVATPPQITRPSPAPLVASLPAPPPATREQKAALVHAAKGVEALGVLVQYLMFRLDALNDTWRKEADRWRGVAAAERNNAARAELERQQRAQKDFDTIAECLSKISELEIEVSSKDEVNARLQATHIEEISALANDIKELKETIEILKREVAESRARLHAHSEIERTLRAQLEAVRSDYESTEVSCDTTYQSCNQSVNRSYNVSDAACDPICQYESLNFKSDRLCNVSDAACDPICCELEECELRLTSKDELSSDANELAKEVRSLRAVIELKQAEVASLRGARSELSEERERRIAAERDACAARHVAEELKERALSRQKDVDRLRDDNRRLRDVATRDRDHAARLFTLNEELRYKLRQKSQVVSLLASGGYIERSLRTRTTSCDSTRSPSPPLDSPPSPRSPAPEPPVPAVKAVVEKQDSVSWVLEIEETPEEMASRLARRSSFRTSSSPGGVKRRGGNSPNSSPAPASPAPNASKLFRPEIDFPPPPLKESAGEAIYIYDDRQY